MKFDAAVLIKQNAPLELLTISLDKPLREGQVLVRMIASGICGAQLNEISGIKGPDRFLPHLLGHEGFGEVTDVSPGVRKVASGDRVVLHWRKGLGIEAPPATFSSDIGAIGAGPVTTFSEYSVVSENRVTKVESNLDPEVGALLGCGITTGFGIVNREVRVLPYSNCLVVGLGGLGSNIIQALKLSSVESIRAYDRSEAKAHLAGQVGASQFFYPDGPEEGLRQAFVRSFGPAANLPEFIFETTGNTDIISDCFDLLAANGSLVLVGQPKLDSRLTLRNPLSFFAGKRIFASDGGLTNPDVDIPGLAKLVLSKTLRPEVVISHRIHLGEVNHAIDEMRKGRTARVIIHYD